MMSEGDYREHEEQQSDSNEDGSSRRNSQGRSGASGRRSGSRPSVRASGARTTARTGEGRSERTRTRERTPRADDERRAARSTDVRSRRGEQARHHLLTNTTYSPASQNADEDSTSSASQRRASAETADEAASQSSTRPRTRTTSRSSERSSERTSSRTSARSRSNDVEEPETGIRGVLGSIIRAISGFLDNLPFPKSYLLIVLAAIILAIIIGVGVSTCSSSAPSEQQEQTDQQEQEDQGPNADIPEELRWRDTDFAVDPARNKWNYGDNGRKVVYLTIDDGPSELTEQYLDLFDQYNVKATFFVTGHFTEYADLIHEAYKRGHTIGLHTMTHDFPKVYASEDAYFADLDAIGQVVKDQIGYVPCFIRFPGGSSNTQADNYSPGLMAKLVDDVQTRGYQYFDWNVESGDGNDVTAEQMIQTIKDSELDTNLVVLCHDSATKQSTLEALPDIIKYYQGLGYTFEAIDRNTWVPHHLTSTVELSQYGSASDSTTEGTTSGTTDGTTSTTEGAIDGTADNGTGEAGTEGETGEQPVQTDEDGDYV